MTTKNVCLSLPGNRYYEVPREVLEKYAVTKDAFDKEVVRKWRAGETVFDGADVEGQEDDDGGGSTVFQEAYGAMREWVTTVVAPDAPPPPRMDSVMGVRG
jgi:hypothetical protein